MTLSSMLLLIGALLVVAVCLVVVGRRSRSSSSVPTPSDASLDAQAHGEANRSADRQGRS